MSNLKKELIRLTTDFELKSDLLDTLAGEAFIKISKICKTEAARGKHTAKNLPIEFCGSKGGNRHHFTAVLKRLGDLLDAERLNYTLNTNHTDYQITVYW